VCKGLRRRKEGINFDFSKVKMAAKTQGGGGDTHAHTHTHTTPKKRDKSHRVTNIYTHSLLFLIACWHFFFLATTHTHSTLLFPPQAARQAKKGEGKEGKEEGGTYVIFFAHTSTHTHTKARKKPQHRKHREKGFGTSIFINIYTVCECVSLFCVSIFVGNNNASIIYEPPSSFPFLLYDHPSASFVPSPFITSGIIHINAFSSHTHTHTHTQIHKYSTHTHNKKMPTHNQQQDDYIYYGQPSTPRTHTYTHTPRPPPLSVLKLVLPYMPQEDIMNTGE
jgi:hypothetical protein